MKLIAPDYYNEFKCIASDCRHSCCIGWEIDVDEDMLAVYDAVEGKFGKRLRENIAREGDEAHFILGDGERCPFLNEKGLCDIIIEMGEESLCQICADHPRFRNFLSDRTEIGLGLCCEAAGRLILSRKDKVQFVVIDDCGGTERPYKCETEALEMRKSILDILQNRNKPVEARVREMAAFCGFEMPDISWESAEEILLELERLDPEWERYVKMLSKGGGAKLSGSEWEIAFEQLAVYFLFRHFIGAAEDGDIAGRVGLIAFGWMIIRRICEECAAERTDFNMDDLVEIARMYSSEIEYSDENMDALMELFDDE